MGLVFLKLGGSLITDKTQPYAARHATLKRLGNELHEALDTATDLEVFLGHGSGSFGHWAAKPHSTRQGVHTPGQWRGYAEVAAAAARLNRIVTDALIDAGVPALSIQPSASARCRDGVLTYMDTRAMHASLATGLVPLVYGDVALDDVRGGTIISTEDIFLFLAGELCPDRILLLGEVEGVLDGDGRVIPYITPSNLTAVQGVLSGSAGVDVTGGMADKVTRMVELVQRHPQTSIHILTGTEPGLLTRALLDSEMALGTRIAAL
jgi:isopentenyl phosphate kinase